MPRLTSFACSVGLIAVAVAMASLATRSGAAHGPTDTIRPQATPKKQYCLPGAACFPTPAEVTAFGATLDGSLYTASSPGWANVSSILNPLVNPTHVPAMVVKAKTAKDAVLSVNFAAKYNLLLSMKSTGHCYTGNCQAPESMNLDMSGMNWIELNKATMTAVVGPGSNFQHIYAACHEEGLLAVGGMCPTVGMVGYSLGGGHGPLVRSFGLGADQIVDVTLVIANGSIVTASGQGTHLRDPVTHDIISTSSNTDLYWALRGGGGGSFGVVVNMTIKVHPAPPGPLPYMECFYAVNNTAAGSPGYSGPAVLQHYYDTVKSPSFSSKWGIFTLTLEEPIPFTAGMPAWNASLKGLIDMEGLFLGTYEEAVASAAPLTEFMKEAQLECSIKNISSFLEWHSTRWFGKDTTTVRQLMASHFPQRQGLNTKQLAEVVSQYTLNMPGVPLSFNSLCSILLGGAVGAVQVGSTAIGPAFRGAAMLQEAVANWLFSFSDKDNEGWSQAAAAAIGAVPGVNGSYVNESPETLQDWTTEYWGAANFARLQSIKDRWDPTSVFWCDHCVFNSAAVLARAERDAMPSL